MNIQLFVDKSPLVLNIEMENLACLVHQGDLDIQ
jgi:hypothetical protein